MAHLQFRGRRISGQPQTMFLGRSTEIELWGPAKSDNQQYKLVTSDATAVSVTLGSYVPARNVQVYKLTAKGFSTRTKIEIIDGDLIDPARDLEVKNLKRPYSSCDFMFMTVLPNASTAPYAEYFEEVIPAIASGLASYNASASTKLVDKAGFLLAHTYNEQSPGATIKPSLHGNRMFNVQAKVTFDAAHRMTILPGQEEPGVTIGSLLQGEGATDATRVPKASPTFYYGTAELAVIHYLEILGVRYSKANAVLTDDRGTFSNFAKALEGQGYATDATYADDLISRSGQPIHQGKMWLEYKLKAIDHDIAVSDDETQKGLLRAQRDLLLDFQVQLANFRK